MWRISNDRIDRLVVFAEVTGSPTPIGEMVFDGTQKRISYFRYAASWLERIDPPLLFPTALPRRRKATPSAPHEVPLPFYDAAPDGWGKTLLRFAFPSQVFGMAEYLAAAGSERTGELMIGPSPEEGPIRWLPADDSLADIPGDAETLEQLLDAAAAVEAGEADRHHVRLLLRSGVDVGGARPKARVRTEEGEWIAKFPASGDSFDDPRMEALCLSLAAVCGIETPEHHLISVQGRSVLLVKRFDRSEEGRLGYCSAATLMGQAAIDYATDASYCDVAIKARIAGIRPCEKDLFRRLLFNCAINNTDDHLRNHAFIRDSTGWRLSPVFDVVVGRGRRLVLRPAPGVSPATDVETALSAAPAFSLTSRQAIDIWEEMRFGLADLPGLVSQYELKQRDQDIMTELAPTLAGFLT
jgi:serine/threonine-protein kinase HipA